MSLGVHFALTTAQLKKLHALEGDDDGVLEFMSEVEERWDRAWLVETDKSWDAMHRALTNGKLTFASGKKHAAGVHDSGRCVARRGGRRDGGAARACAGR